MSKHKATVLSLLSKDEIKSTNQVVSEIKDKTGTAVNWYVVYHILKDLANENRIESLKSKAGLFWRKR